jgi:hypothetical protein
MVPTVETCASIGRTGVDVGPLNPPALRFLRRADQRIGRRRGIGKQADEEVVGSRRRRDGVALEVLRGCMYERNRSLQHPTAVDVRQGFRRPGNERVSLLVGIHKRGLDDADALATRPRESVAYLRVRQDRRLLQSSSSVSADVLGSKVMRTSP